MFQGGRKVIRYSHAFKQKVVNEIENGDLTIGEARRLYEITGSETIQKWIQAQGKHHLLNKVVRVEMKDEKDALKTLKEENKKLKEVIARLEVDKLALEELLAIGKEEYGLDLKKKRDSRDVSAWLKSETQQGKDSR